MMVYSGIVEMVHEGRQGYQAYLIIPDLVFNFQPDEVIGLWRRAYGPIPIGARCAWTWGSGPTLRRNFVTILYYWVETPPQSH